MLLRPALLLCSLPAFAQVDAQAIRSVFSEYDHPGSPGCAVGVLKDGKFIHQQGYGFANLDYDLPLTSKTVFDIGSTSKQFSALAILLLEKDGKLSIEDPVRKYISELPDYGTPVTIHQLLSHTSGIRDYLALSQLAGNGPDDFFTDPEVVTQLARQKNLNFKPGDEFLYSNSGYFLVSQIVLRVSGRSLPQFLEARVFKPLGMTNTHSHDDHTRIVKNRATGYELENGKIKISMSTLDMVGDGGIYTTVEDLAKWDAAFYDANSEFAPLLKRMQTSTVLNNGSKTHYGMGLFNESWSGQPMISHGGAWVGFRAELVRLPEQHFSVITLCNLANINPMASAKKVVALYYPGKSDMEVPTLPPPSTSQFTPTALKSFEGRYDCDELNATYMVTSENGKLTLTVRRNHWTLTQQSDNVFAGPRMSAAFTANGFTLDYGRVRGLHFIRVN